MHFMCGTNKRVCFFMLVEKGVTFNIKRLQRKLKREIGILVIVCWNVGKTWKDSIKKKCSQAIKIHKFEYMK